MPMSVKMPGYTPRIVSIYDLRKMLMPFMVGVPSAEDDLMDLWRMGAPDPSPAHRPCAPGTCQLGGCGKWGCRKERRILLLSQFATWWKRIADRQGLALKVGGK